MTPKNRIMTGSSWVKGQGIEKRKEQVFIQNNHVSIRENMELDHCNLCYVEFHPHRLNRTRQNTRDS